MNFLKNLTKEVVKRIVRLSDYLSWLIFSPYKIKNMNKASIKKVLVINTAFIGDVLATTPLIRNLKEEFGKVDVLVSEASKEVLLNNPNVKEILIFKNHKDFVKRCSRKYDLAVCVWPCDLEMAITLRKAEIPYRLGATQQSRPEKGRFFMTSLAPPFFIDRHKVIENISIVRPLLSKKKFFPMEVFPSQEDERFVKNYILKHKIKEYAIIHPSVRSKGSKEWVDSRFAEIADYLIKKKRLTVLLGGSKKDAAKNNNIISKIKNKKKIKNVAGKTTLLQYAAMISKSTLVVSVSTGTLHLACALKSKLIGLYSENLKIWYPWQNKRNSQVLCNSNMNKISSEQVILKINKLLPG